MRRAFLAVLLTAGLVGCAARTAVWVFTAPWDARSDAALDAGVAPAATIVSGWIALDSLGGPPVALYPPRALPKPRSTRPFALVTSYRADRFHPQAVRALAADPVARARAADGVEALVRAGGYAGVVLDLEALEPADSLALPPVVGALGAAARRGGAREVALAVPATDTLPYPVSALAPHVDRFLVMLYDEHWAGSAPGPVASRGWAQAALARWARAAGPGRLAAALPAYGYLWRADSATAVVGWGEVQALGRAAGVAATRDTASGGVRLRLADGREAWVADASLAGAMARDARALRVPVLAVWRLGLEDPAVWGALGLR
ncbi:MAG: glycosyl hydrolase family 18 protein [Gemmatimonadales bacterium]|nr:glycosyl hydrolase family 18 protein [Gemmatimonadales bacterium]